MRFKYKAEALRLREQNTALAGQTGRLETENRALREQNITLEARLAALREQNAESAKGAERLEAENTALAGENWALQKQNAALQTQLTALQGQNRALAEQAVQAGRFAVQWENFLRYDGTPQPEDFSLAAGQAPGWGLESLPGFGPGGLSAAPAPASEWNSGAGNGAAVPVKEFRGAYTDASNGSASLSGGRSASGPKNGLDDLQAGNPKNERNGLQAGGPTGKPGSLLINWGAAAGTLHRGMEEQNAGDGIKKGGRHAD